jgi:hypothetical protein
MYTHSCIYTYYIVCITYILFYEYTHCAVQWKVGRNENKCVPVYGGGPMLIWRYYYDVHACVCAGAPFVNWYTRWSPRCTHTHTHTHTHTTHQHSHTNLARSYRSASEENELLSRPRCPPNQVLGTQYIGTRIYIYDTHGRKYSGGSL